MTKEEQERLKQFAFWLFVTVLIESGVLIGIVVMLARINRP